MSSSFPLRIHHHDGQRDAVAAQLHALIAVGHGEVVHMVELKDVGNLHFASAIRCGLDHGHELGGGSDERAVVIEVAYHGVEVHLQSGLVRLALQQLGDALEMKHAGTFEQDGLVLEVAKVMLLDKLFRAVIEESLGLAGKAASVVAKDIPDADEFADAALRDKIANLTIEFMLGHAALDKIAHDERLVGMLWLMLHKFQSDNQ